MIESNIEAIAVILSIVLFLIATFASAGWGKAKNILRDIRHLVVAVDDAFEDDKVSDGEVRLIIKRLKKLCDI